MIRFSNFHYNREPSYFFIFLSQMYYTLTKMSTLHYTTATIADWVLKLIATLNTFLNTTSYKQRPLDWCNRRYLRLRGKQIVLSRALNTIYLDERLFEKLL